MILHIQRVIIIYHYSWLSLYNYKCHSVILVSIYYYLLWLLLKGYIYEFNCYYGLFIITILTAIVSSISIVNVTLKHSSDNYSYAQTTQTVFYFLNEHTLLLYKMNNQSIIHFQSPHDFYWLYTLYILYT